MEISYFYSITISNIFWYHSPFLIASLLLVHETLVRFYELISKTKILSINVLGYYNNHDVIDGRFSNEILEKYHFHISNIF